MLRKMENWKDIAKEKDWVSNFGLVPLFLTDWEASMLDVLLEFLNTFLIKGLDIYFGYKV